MSNLLIFGGTTEGRKTGEFLDRYQIPYHMCVATDNGQEALKDSQYRRLHTGRLDQEQMVKLLREESIDIVIDATHPYASEVTINIREAAGSAEARYLRLVRTEDQGTSDCIYVDSIEEAAAYLAGKKGNILAVTGSKQLDAYTALADYRSRVYLRVLPARGIIEKCMDAGFEASHIICMQGPFDAEMNAALLRQKKIDYMVTKESGAAGGFREKLEGARLAGSKVIVIGRPLNECGMDLYGIYKYIIETFAVKTKQTVAVIGAGMGSKGSMTLDAMEACRRADLLIGADRVAEAAGFKKPIWHAYKASEIADYIRQHPEYENIAVMMSGDVGFYSGAKRLLPALAQMDVETQVYPGISSVVYLSAKLGTGWEDTKLVSMHGREANIVAEVRASKKVFVIVSGEAVIHQICRQLMQFGLADVDMYVGENMSYDRERMIKGRPEELLQQSFDKISSVCIFNSQAVQPAQQSSLSDEAFIRGKVPLTKAEIRHITLAKLQLTKDACIYDIGAGTGGMSVEMALSASEGTVWAVEYQEDALQLIEKNANKMAAANLKIVRGKAPEAIRELPVPTHAFIGGSSGNLEEIIRVILDKNPQARIVLNAITLETVARAMECLRMFKVKDTDISCVQVSKGQAAGSYHLMKAQNPVYIIAFTGV